MQPTQRIAGAREAPPHNPFASRSWTYLWAVVPTYEPHPPFYYSLLKLWSGIAGSGPFALRSLSLLFSVATIPVIMAAALELDRQRPTGRAMLSAVGAGFLAACSPMLVLLDQEARPYPLMILAYAAGVWGLLRLLREFRQGGPGEWSSWLLLACSTEVSLWAHGLGVIYAFCLAAALFPGMVAGPLNSRRVARSILMAGAVVLAYLPCLAMILGRAADWGTGWLWWGPLKLLQIPALYSVPYEALTAGSAVAGLAMLVLAIRAIQAAIEIQGWSSERALLVLWLGPPLLAAAVSQLGMPIFLPRTLAPTLAPAYIAMAAALARTKNERQRNWLAAAIAVTLVPTAIQIALRPAAEDWSAVRAFLSRNVGPGDEVWLYPNDSALALDALGPHSFIQRGIPGDYPAVGFKGPIRGGSPAVVSVTRDQALAIARSPASARPRTVWVVTRQSIVFDPQGELPRALADVRRAGTVRRWGHIEVQPFTKS